MTDEWQDHAACLGMDPDVFFPAHSGFVPHAGEAKQVCASCRVRNACLEFALETFQMHGIWGGLSPRERSRLRTSRRKTLVSQRKAG